MGRYGRCSNNGWHNVLFEFISVFCVLNVIVPTKRLGDSMINIKRRKRQAFENSNVLITGVMNSISNKDILNKKVCLIYNIDELNSLIKDIEPELLSLAQSLQPDWAIPIVLQVIGELFYGRYTQYKHIGNYFKRSLAYLWQNSCTPHGDYKNVARLERLISLCYVIETLYSFRKMFVAIPNLWFSFENGHAIIPNEFHADFLNFGMMVSGKGKRFRVAETNSRLMNECPRPFLQGLIRVLDGEQPRQIEVFRGTFYEDVPGIENSECAKFWKEVFCRFSLYLATLLSCGDSEQPENVVLFKEFAIVCPDKYLTQDIAENSFWKLNWFKHQSAECYGNLIVAKPIMRISPNGDFATSPVLIGDSLNHFVENQLLGYSTRSPYLNLPSKIFKDAFSEKFEDQCIQLFRNHGFVAGHILETGVWKTQNENITLGFSGENLFGEVDVFAFHPDRHIAFLIECKVLLDVQDSRSYQNIVSKLKDDSEGFRFKLRKKASWIRKAFDLNFGLGIEPVMILLTDIPLPVLGANDEEIAITDYGRLEYWLETVDDKIIE